MARQWEPIVYRSRVSFAEMIKFKQINLLLCFSDITNAIEEKFIKNKKLAGVRVSPLWVVPTFLVKNLFLFI